MDAVTRALAACLLLGLLAAPAAGQEEQQATPEVRAFLKAWAAKMHDVRTLEVHFRQTKTLRMLRRPLVSRGVALLRGRTLLMTVVDEAGELQTALLVTPGEAKLYHPRHHRLEVFPLREGAPPPTPFPLFGGDVEALPETYAIQLLPGKDETDLLVFTPRDERAQVSEFRMWFRDYEVVAVEQRGRRGDRVRMDIDQFTINPPLDEERLKLHVAPGTEVVHVTGEDR